MQKAVNQLSRENKRLGFSFSECCLRAVGNFHGFSFLKKSYLKNQHPDYMQETVTLQRHASSLSHGAKREMELKSKIPLSTPCFPPSSHAMALVWEAIALPEERENSKYALLDTSASCASTRTGSGAPASTSCLLRGIKCAEVKRM